jgi:hypothetical protein
LDQAKQAKPIDEKLVIQLTTKQDELESLYLSSLKLFPNQFINRDGTYSIEEELGQLNATEGRKADTNPDTFKDRGAKYDNQVSKMQVALIILAASLFFFAIISTVEGLNKVTLLVFVLIGYLAATAGVTIGIKNWEPVLLNEQTPAEISEETAPATATKVSTLPTVTLVPLTPTNPPTETQTPVQVMMTSTPDPNVTLPLAPSIGTWDFFCSTAKKTMGIKILWTDAAFNESGYRILRNGEVVAELPAGSTSFTESIPLVKETKMIYQIEVFNTGGSTFSLEISFGC